MIVRDAKNNGKVKEMIEKLEQNAKRRLDLQNRKVSKAVSHDSNLDVVEIYSRPRIASMAKRLGMKAGWLFDITGIDEADGETLDVSKSNKKLQARAKVQQDKPFMFIASPMCMAFCRLQELFNYPKMKIEEVEGLIGKAMEHLKFASQTFIMLHKAGRLFIFE